MKLEGFCQVLEEALAIAHKDLERLILVRELMSRVTAKTRSNSKLPELVELFLSRPLVTGPLAAKLLKVTPKVMDVMLAQLGPAARAHRPHPLPRLGHRVKSAYSGSKVAPLCRLTAMVQGSWTNLNRRRPLVRRSWKHADRSGLSSLPPDVQGPAAEAPVRGGSDLPTVPARVLGSGGF
jgi:hypothetical protein